jgi:hypothetical protein
MKALNQQTTGASTMNTTTQEFGESFEQFLPSKKVDQKGRVIGFIVGQRDNGTDFHAWVQNGRYLGNGEYIEFGAQQRSVRFGSKDAARSWAYSTAKERIAKLAA